ncbi:MAG: carboxypeptidase-like regulatory domain-containing protein [Planctomycetota bacterium]|nr:carboxypeptidase-like regulatory domain-containing protein [Planctomycetota bacterium]
MLTVSPMTRLAAFLLALCTTLPAQSAKLRVIDLKGGPVQSFLLTVRKRESAKAPFATLPQFAGKHVEPRDFKSDFLVLSDLADGEYYALVAADLHAPTKCEPFRVQGDLATPEVTIRLTRGGVIAGRVVDAAGKPVAGVTVASGAELGMNFDIEIDDPAWATLPDATFRSVVTDAGGAFRLPLLVFGSYRLTAIHPQFCLATQHGLQVKDDQAVVAPTITMVRGAVVAGKAMRAGAPMEKLTLWIELPVTTDPIKMFQRRTGFQARAVSGADGRFRFEHPIPPGTYNLCATVNPRAKDEPALRNRAQKENGREIVIEAGKDLLDEVFEFPAK